MKTVTMKTKAWFTEHSTVGPKDLIAGKRLDDLAFNSQSNMGKHGWTFAGDAEITLMLVDERTLVENKIKALREQATEIRAEATAKVTRIESQIQDLLAISYDPQSGDTVES